MSVVMLYCFFRQVPENKTLLFSSYYISLLEIAKVVALYTFLDRGRRLGLGYESRHSC